MEEKYTEEYNPIINAQLYYRAQMIKDIIFGMSSHVSNIFDEIDNVYSSGEQISKEDIEQMIEDIRKDIDVMKIYFK